MGLTHSLPQLVVHILLVKPYLTQHVDHARTDPPTLCSSSSCSSGCPSAYLAG